MSSFYHRLSEPDNFFSVLMVSFFYKSELRRPRQSESAAEAAATSGSPPYLHPFRKEPSVRPSPAVPFRSALREKRPARSAGSKLRRAFARGSRLLRHCASRRSGRRLCRRSSRDLHVSVLRCDSDVQKRLIGTEITGKRERRIAGDRRIR